MTALLTQFTRLPSNAVPNSPQQPPSPGSSPRFSLPHPIEPSLDPVPRSPSLFSSLLSSSSTKPAKLTTPLDVAPRPTTATPNPPAPLPRPRALSSSHLPPPFPSPSGAFLPPPASHWLPLVLPPARNPKRSTHPNLDTSDPGSAGQNTPSNHTPRRARSHSQCDQPHSAEPVGRASDASSLAEHVHRRSAPPITSSLALLVSPKTTTTATLPWPGSLIRIRDFGFSPDDPRHTGLLKPPSHPAEQGMRVPENDSETRAERSASYLCMLSSQGPTLWTTLLATDPKPEESDTLDEDETNGELESDDGLDSDDDLREEIERRRESLDKSIQSIGRPSIGSGMSEDVHDFDGLWVAIYAFEAEGESEMGLSEGEVVRVVRPVCHGWVVARKVPGELDEAGNFIERVLGAQDVQEGEEDDNEQVGLCPKNYLARV